MAHRSEFVSIAGTRTHLIRGGRGKPLLILHPEFGAGRWFPYHEQLVAHFQVFAPDHPGFGESDRPDWLRDIDDMVFHYVDLLDTLQLDRVSVLGTSIGGWIAAELAVARPDRVERLVLVAAAGIKIDGVERFDVFLNPIEETLLHLFHDPARTAQLLPAEMGADVIVRAYREASSLARLTWNPYLYNPKLARRLHRIAAPTLLLWGDADPISPLAVGQHLQQQLPDARLHVVKGGGHDLARTHADEVAPLIERHLTED